MGSFLYLLAILSLAVCATADNGLTEVEVRGLGVDATSAVKTLLPQQSNEQ